MRVRKKYLAAATAATAASAKLAHRKVSSLQLYICEYRVTKMVSSGYKQYKTHQIDFNLTGIITPFIISNADYFSSNCIYTSKILYTLKWNKF